MGEEYKVIFAPRANDDLEAVVRYIARRSGPDIASRFGTQLLEKALTLSRLPERGRIAPELSAPYREIIFRSYRIVYRISGKKVQVIRFWHAARGTPEIDSDAFGISQQP